MLAFFLGQMDFIYFFYGLAFLLIGLVCFLLANIEKRDIPWSLLGAFAITRGVYQWLVLSEVIFGKFVLMDLFILVLYISSFICLFEFGRRGVNNGKIRLATWIYIPIVAVLCVSWWIGGIDLLTASMRYTFGFFGGMLAAFTFMRHLSESHVVKGFLNVVVACFFVYGLSQFIVDSNLFLHQTGVLIQFVRAIFITLIFLGLWFQYEYLIEREIKKQDDQKMKQRKSFKMILFVFLLASTYIFGYVLLNQLGEQAKKELGDESVATTEMITANIHNIMRIGDTMAMTLSSFSRTATSLESSDLSTLELNSILDQFVKSIGDSVCYLMNKDGIVVASSNRNAPDSFLGKNYAFRPYFTKAMQGEHGAIFALGITSGLPGYYSSFPIKNDNGDILGVSVVKMNMDTLEAYFHLHSDVVMVSPEGVVFLTGDPLFIGKTISPITESVKQSILINRQYGIGEFAPLFSEPPKDDSLLTYQNKTFLLNTRQITSDGWKIYVMRDASRFVHYRLFGLLLILLFYVLIVTFLVIIKLTKRSVIFSYLAAVVYSSQDAIIGKDLSGKILSWNKGAENIYGYTKKEMIGKMIDDLLPKDQVEKNRLIIEAIHQGKVVENFEMKQLRKNGEAIDVSVTISPMRDMTESIVGVSMIAHDISRMKRLEKIKSEFVSIASHQLRTPLTGIKWFSELLLNGRVGALNKAQTEYLQQISDSNQRMINLVNDLLEVSHIDDQGKYKMDFVKVDFADVVKEIVGQQKMIAKSKNVSIVLSPECVKKNILTIDQIKMSQTLQNLLSNAIKFAKPKTKIVIDCSKQKGQLVCSITDQGLGIPLAQQGRIFEKFFRADNAVETGSGTGLGLYIAKAIVEAHKGKIWFESEEGKGTTFTFSLPLK